MMNTTVAGRAARIARRAEHTGNSFGHTLKREAARWARARASGQILSGGLPQPQSETPLPGATIPGVPKPDIETPLPGTTIEKPLGDLNPGATAPTPEKPARKAKGAKKTATTEKTTKAAETPAASTATPGADDPEFAKKRKHIGKTVTWSAFGQENTGTIAFVIPKGATPRSLDIEAGGEKAKARDHISYVVKKPDGSLVWPVVKGMAIA